MSTAFLSDYVVSYDGSFLQMQDEAFSDVSAIRSYFNTEKKEEKDYQEKYETINSIMDFYSEIRGNAEADEEVFYRTFDKRHEIPISYEEMSKALDTLETTNNPPLRLISEIADGYSKLSKLLEQLHVVLRRERKKVPVSKAQQLDPQCMRWLSKQPGVTVEQKAGNSQMILSVVREESADTIENRVLKAFLKLCVVESDSYVHEFSKKFSSAKRIDDVRRLGVLAKHALSNPIFSQIKSIKGSVKPNYVLQNNPLYNFVWHYYQQLLSKTVLVERLWATRHIIIRELVSALFLLLEHKKHCKEPSFKHEFWVAKFPSENKGYLSLTNWDYFDFNKDGIIEFDCKSSNNIKFSWNSRLVYIGKGKREDGSIGNLYMRDPKAEPIKREDSFKFVFLWNEEVYFKDNSSEEIIIYNETGCKLPSYKNYILIDRGTDFVLNLYKKLKEVFDV